MARKPATADDPWLRSLALKDVQGYRLDAYVGHGRVGVVYRAHDRDVPDREVAIKLIPGSPRPGWENELRKVAKLAQIPGVVQFHALGTCQIRSGDRTELFQFTAWDFIPPGRSLRAYLTGRRSCSTSFVFAVVEQVLLVLHACTKRGVTRHGDLHAGNILVGDPDAADLDANLRPRERVFVSDFGYGTTGAAMQPKDDYHGLAEIGSDLLQHAEWDAATATDRQRLVRLRDLLHKLLEEAAPSERREPLEILRAMRSFQVSSAPSTWPHTDHGFVIESQSQPTQAGMTVGQFQVAEMLGDDWERWKRLFVPTVPARSRILENDISTVVTGPRGCGKTMLFRRLSERLVIECGPVAATDGPTFFGLYVNANVDVASAFSSFPAQPSRDEVARLVAYTNLCILSDFLAVFSARAAHLSEEPSAEVLAQLEGWLPGDAPEALLVGESKLERYRARLEAIKWRFPANSPTNPVAGLDDLTRTVWLPYFLRFLRTQCIWLGNRRAFLFFDDYTTPRVSASMQRVLNSLLFQRSSEFIAKVATESATTFVAEDSSGKLLQDGDDYQLIDLSEETLGMEEEERFEFLDQVFRRRLSLDSRVADRYKDLRAILGTSGISKTEFARRLRATAPRDVDHMTTRGKTKRKGRSKAKALYHGADIFEGLWSGDTRIMIQLVQDLLDEAGARAGGLEVPLGEELQDRVLRNRGGMWLEAQRRNHPTDVEAVDSHVRQLRKSTRFDWAGGSYGAHLKAIVEAFVVAARQLLLGPTYIMQEAEGGREVPRMAFRIEILDEFRLDGLAVEIYSDLLRYGLFMRDSRGKSVRGAMVPRLFLRRFLLPYCTLALSKRDSVQLKCDDFVRLLLYPDTLKRRLERDGARRLLDDVAQRPLFPSRAKAKDKL